MQRQRDVGKVGSIGKSALADGGDGVWHLHLGGFRLEEGTVGNSGHLIVGTIVEHLLWNDVNALVGVVGSFFGWHTCHSHRVGTGGGVVESTTFKSGCLGANGTQSGYCEK